VKGADPVERICTYNFPQSRVTDHRINLTIQNLPAIMDGDLDEMTEALMADDCNKWLSAASDET